MKRKCPFCYRELNGGSSHIYKCKNIPLNLSKENIKFEFYKFNFPEISDKDILYKEHSIKNKTLPVLRTEYNVDFKSIQWLMKYHGIKKRTHAEGVLIAAKKTKETVKEKYGVNNISQLKEIKEKKKKTFIKHYGVDNIRKWKPFYDYVNKIIKEKYGITKSELISIKSKEVWERKTDEQKQNWLLKSIHTDEAMAKSLKHAGYRTSKLETKIENVLKENNISYTHQFILKNFKKRKFYDFYLPEYNIIIEINGDYWHANPYIYKPNDIIHYCFGDKKAKEIWEKDKKKKELAENKGYKIIYIWEMELKQLKTNKQILECLIIKLNNYEN